jgi:hypothetical protein
MLVGAHPSLIASKGHATDGTSHFSNCERKERVAALHGSLVNSGLHIAVRYRAAGGWSNEDHADCSARRRPRPVVVTLEMTVSPRSGRKVCISMSPLSFSHFRGMDQPTNICESYAAIWAGQFCIG